MKGREDFRHVVHDVVGVDDDIGEQPGAHRQADDAARDAGHGGVEQILPGDFGGGVAQGLQGAHLLALLLHHAGHGGQGHQGGHQEEEQREHRGDGRDFVRVGIVAGEAGVVRPGVDVPLALLNLPDFALRVGQFLLGVGELLLGLLIALVVVVPALLDFLGGGFQLGQAVVVLGLGVVELCLGAGELRLGRLDALPQLGGALVQLGLGAVQGGLLALQGLALGVQLRLAGVQLGLGGLVLAQALLVLGQARLILGVALLPGGQGGGSVRALGGQGVEALLQGGELLPQLRGGCLQLGDEGQGPGVAGVRYGQARRGRRLEQRLLALGQAVQLGFGGVQLGLRGVQLCLGIV